MFFATRAAHLRDERRAFTLSGADIALLNPNTRTCPVFRSQADAELTKKIYRRVPVLIDESKGAAGNPWGISFSAMFHMSNDSGLFRTAAQLTADGAQRDGPNWIGRDKRSGCRSTKPRWSISSTTAGPPTKTTAAIRAT